VIPHVEDPIAADARLEAIVCALVDSANPSRVILFGSRARSDAGPDSDYDLVVELEFDDYRACRRRLREAVRDASGGIAIDLIPRLPGQLESRRDDPGYMDWAIAREGVIVFPPGTDSRSLRPSRGLVRESEPYRSIAEWLSRAAEDLRDIHNNVAAGESASWSAVCFHSQQLAEKYLKALFIQEHRHPPRTHDLAELIRELRGLGVDVPLFPEACALLSDYAVPVRYPENTPIPDESMGRTAFAGAVAIAEAVKLRLRV
jgi:uncharacterized protein